MNNIFKNIPSNLDNEIFEDIQKSSNIRIERIISKGQSSPDSGWYDQIENEWLIVLQGSGIILFEGGKEKMLNKGDYINIPAHIKHKVKWTDPEEITLWLAIFY